MIHWFENVIRDWQEAAVLDIVATLEASARDAADRPVHILQQLQQLFEVLATAVLNHASTNGSQCQCLQCWYALK